jgi:hypothetical protein
MLFAPTAVFLPFLLIWGAAITPDSPQFSTLVAFNAPADNKGTALTLVTSIGFAITIASIALVGALFHYYNSPLVFLILAIGPFAGLRALYKNAIV